MVGCQLSVNEFGGSEMSEPPMFFILNDIYFGALKKGRGERGFTISMEMCAGSAFNVKSADIDQSGICLCC